ncbi:replication-relaxation family protein [uncultured Roseibium sp.]|uniref:replication-relaxation family protein n=1 Tax=uncultured Roseibium sp. TaxID=1936171 RepID=UPI003217685F
MPLDALGRRSRFSRQPTGKRIALTERDTAILRLLYRYRYLRVSQLLAFLQPRSEKRFVERLGDLYHETGLINRPQAQWRAFYPRSTPLIYELSAKGRRYLSEHGDLPHRVTSLAQATAPGRAPQFEHAMMIVDALAEIELTTRQEPDQRFVPVGEILERAPDRERLNGKSLAAPVTIQPGPLAPWLKRPFHTHLIPDGLYGIEYLIDGKKLYRFWALECENMSPKTRSTAKRSSLALKKAAYDAFISGKGYREVWGIPNLQVRVVCRKLEKLTAR